MKSYKVMTILLGASVFLSGCSENAESTGNEKTETSAPSVNSLQKETDEYKQFALGQMDQFVKETAKFVNAVKEGRIDEAKALYSLARMYFERSEPIAESFGDLDPRIDARLADLEEAGQGKEQWSGYHKIEYGLWVDGTTKGYEDTADQLLKDAKELRARVETVEVKPELMITGAVDLLNEVSTSKITGEEEIYSHTDLYDFKANIEGAEEIFHIFEPALQKKDKQLVKDLTDKFKMLNNLLAKHEDKNGGYVSYEKLTKEDTKQLADAVNQLGEPLSMMGIVME